VDEVLVSNEEVVNEENDKCNKNLEANIVYEDEKPQVGMIFSSKDELREYYKS
jgi:hypothetical protein